jgi:ribose-phosphate pyrophosphokinase
MRQDKAFNTGEVLFNVFKFNFWICRYFVTIVHTTSEKFSITEIYSIPTTVSHAASHISAWIKYTIKTYFDCGPDSESEQWVAEVAKNANAPL